MADLTRVTYIDPDGHEAHAHVPAGTTHVVLTRLGDNTWFEWSTHRSASGARRSATRRRLANGSRVVVSVTDHLT